MKAKALLKTRSMDASSVAKSLQTDNVTMEDLRIKTTPEGKYITTHVESGNLNCLMNTLDDLICCQMVAERVIQ
ncbi:MAG: KEOPS complex subunit Pcc1 [Candidatus Altiarchaeota archaeon]|nr:KEOPS complex subunit Pcc1 [Candidatus Altiarchaeota archaeon]